MQIPGAHTVEPLFENIWYRRNSLAGSGKVRDPKYVEEAANWMPGTNSGALHVTVWAVLTLHSTTRSFIPRAIPKLLRIPRNELLSDNLKL